MKKVKEVREVWKKGGRVGGKKVKGGKDSTPWLPNECVRQQS